MNKYFAEYIPVAGAIREGDKFYDSKFSLLGVKTARWDTESKTQQKMKLHLCSWDIQVGDRVYQKFNKSISDEQYDILKWSFEDRIWLYKDGKPNHTAHISTLFKVMGPISPLANWVKQGDEFSEDQILRYLASDYEYKIKGPCGRFY